MKPALPCPKCGSTDLACISKHPIYLTTEARIKNQPSSTMVVIQCQKCQFTFAESLSDPPPRSSG